MYDVLIIGAGVVGANIARELSKYKLKVCIIDKSDDVSNGASKANSGIVHGGYDDEPGTLKAKLCVKGNRMYEELDKELNFGYRQTGSLVIGFSEEDKAHLKKLYEYGLANGVEGLEIIGKEKIIEMEPYINKDVQWGLYCKNAGVTSPYEFVIALAENAVKNGVDLKLNTEVIGLEKQGSSFKVKTNNGLFKTKYLINSAGVRSDEVSEMAGVSNFKIIPRRGEYILFSKDQSYLVNSVVFQVPTKKGKGILVTTTYHGNLMLGPDAQQVSEKDDVTTDEETLKYILATAEKSIKGFNLSHAITSFAGVRPTNTRKDFIIEETEVKGFINVAGIDSPGLTSSPAIAKMVVDILKNSGLKLIKNDNFDPYRKPIIVKKDKNFQGDINSSIPEKHIICRCETVTEAEIVDALHRGIYVKSIDAIKRRTRAGMGQCQGNFCQPRVRALIARELGIAEEEVTKRGPGSSILPKRVERKEYRKLNS